MKTDLYLSNAGYVYEVTLKQGKWNIRTHRKTQKGGTVVVNAVLKNKKTEKNFFQHYTLLENN